jgi:hypothetical protein
MVHIIVLHLKVERLVSELTKSMVILNSHIRRIRELLDYKVLVTLLLVFKGVIIFCNTLYVSFRSP